MDIQLEMSDRLLAVSPELRVGDRDSGYHCHVTLVTM